MPSARAVARSLLGGASSPRFGAAASRRRRRRRRRPPKTLIGARARRPRREPRLLAVAGNELTAARQSIDRRARACAQGWWWPQEFDAERSAALNGSAVSSSMWVDGSRRRMKALWCSADRERDDEMGPYLDDARAGCGHTPHNSYRSCAMTPPGATLWRIPRRRQSRAFGRIDGGDVYCDRQRGAPERRGKTKGPASRRRACDDLHQTRLRPLKASRSPNGAIGRLSLT